MATRTLITGGAGFIGAHVARRLLASGGDVRVFDSLLPQVHASGSRPSYLSPEVELLTGDMRDPETLERALKGVDHVLHLAARVGVGQSMYEIATYMQVNTYGTTQLLQALLRRPVGRLVVASSMSVYGEGLYQDADGNPVEEVVRRRPQLEAGRWEPLDEQGRTLLPLPTPETKRPSLSSVYALSKFDQERLCLLFGEAYHIPTVALRFFNVYGPYQSLSNPYTGVLAIFASRLLNHRPPVIFEDGNQRRDFVSVHDVARACELALSSTTAIGEAINVGSGHSSSINEIAVKLASLLGVPELGTEVNGKYRVGDIRHCFADISRARELLGYVPQQDLNAGLCELAEWLEGQVAVDNLEAATSDLLARGLAV